MSMKLIIVFLDRVGENGAGSNIPFQLVSIVYAVCVFGVISWNAVHRILCTGCKTPFYCLWIETRLFGMG